MQSNVFLDAFIANARSALSRADALGQHGHAGHRGTLREILVRELLQKVMPPEIKIGGGQLVACDGTLSKQIDIILYSPSIIVPALYSEDQGYFAVDSCLYAIEVKSRLTHAGLTSAYESAVVTKAMTMLPTEHITRAFDPPLRIFVTGTARPICMLFALSSDLSGEPAKEIARYRQIDAAADVDPAISVIVIRGRGYWYFAQAWRFVPANDRLREITALLAGIANTIPQLLAFKGRPRVGNFLSSEEINHEFV